ncbi:RNA-binding protein [Desemzia incerta]|uniref:YlmH family RNA-binding protein n=1 Tax=Desemzia incerta TaxID=82801 RepID=UPI003CFD16FB
MIENVYQHFRKDEIPFIDMVMDWVREVEDQYTPVLTNFLDPRQYYILETIIGKSSEIKLHSFGGYESSERNRAFICPTYFEPKQEDFNIRLYEVKYPVKFATMSHGKILGTLLSTGMKREYFGDIISDGERWQFFIDDSIENYVVSQIDKIGRVAVRLEERRYTDMIVPKDSWTIVHDTVSSMRIDVLVSSVFKISRQRAKQMIESGHIKVNWTEMQRPDFVLDLLDIVSVRGFGRFQIQEIEGKSKKDKWKLELGVLFK